jgi:hypothetical protein
MTDQSSSNISSTTFVKADTGKARPGLIPVIFRRGLREANECHSAAGASISDVYAIIEQYEEGDNYDSPNNYHPVIHAAQLLENICGNNFGCSFLMGLAHVFTMGAKKYSADNWMKCPYEDRHRYVDAFYRHTYAWEGGEELDEESGFHHLFHAGCCLAMLHGIDVLGQIASPAPVEKQNVVRAMDEINEIMLETAGCPPTYTYKMDPGGLY